MSDINQKLVHMVSSELEPRTFSTGSKGFYATGKVTVAGVRYQAQAQAILVGSKDDSEAVVAASADETAAALADLVGHGLASRTFKSGKTGYRADGKITVGGQRFQASVQAVAISAT
jgi:hypothetical protein